MSSAKARALMRLPCRRPCMSVIATMTVSTRPLATSAPSSSSVSMRGGYATRPDGRSGLVEEARVEVARLVLGGQLDVLGREQEDLVGDALHAALERVGEPGGEVDQPLGEARLDGLQIDDDRDAALVAVADRLRVVERARNAQVDLRDVVGADRVGRPQHRGRSAGIAQPPATGGRG